MYRYKVIFEIMVQFSQTPREMATRARAAARQLQALTTEDRVRILNDIADSIEENESVIMKENEADVMDAKGKISESLLQRLILKPAKIAQLADGIRAIARQEEPIGKIIGRTELASGLVLEKVTSPIGVLLIIFEARPDALPQIAALAIRSGNGLLLKGGKEASRSNSILHSIIVNCVEKAAPIVGKGLIGLITSRDEIDALLQLNDVIDLVIPRGSNQLVSYIQNNTKIPVLGHADGICHIYVDQEADDEMAKSICIDSKIDYPAACNAVEKILVHDSLKGERLNNLLSSLREAGVTLHGGEKAAIELGLPPAPSTRYEYSSLDVTIEFVSSLSEAIDHIHANGSGHTESIVTTNKATAEEFLRRVDSACVLHNASTRFSDGYRFGLGAEVGISTSRIHARGPVGVEGLMTTRYLLRGHGQVVKKDTGVSYTHKAMPL